MIVWVLLVILVIGFIIYKINQSYENKVNEALSAFYNSVSIFRDLVNATFKVQTNGKKIRSWNRQHKIDYIINNNAHAIIARLKLFSQLNSWWDNNKNSLVSKTKQNASYIANSMLIFGGSLRERVEKELETLLYRYNPQNIKFYLHTYTHHSNINHYNPNTGEWWQDKSPDEETISVVLTPDEVMQRVELLALNNFEITEYHLHCQNQRSLMTKELKQSIIERDGCICQMCHKQCSPSEIEIDHIQPVSKGGLTIKSNLQVLCKSCNRSKSNKWLSEWELQIKDRSDLGESNDYYYNSTSNSYTQSKRKRGKYEEMQNCVRIGDVVKFIFLDDEDDVFECKIVNSNNKEFLLGNLTNEISSQSPIGQALIGAKINEVIDVEIPSGETQIRVIDFYTLD